MVHKVIQFIKNRFGETMQLDVNRLRPYVFRRYDWAFETAPFFFFLQYPDFHQRLSSFPQQVLQSICLLHSHHQNSVIKETVLSFKPLPSSFFAALLYSLGLIHILSFSPTLGRQFFFGGVFVCFVPSLSLLFHEVSTQLCLGIESGDSFIRFGY